MKSHFFCNGTDLGQKTSIDAYALLNLNSRILKIFHSGVILPPKCHFRTDLRGLRVTELQVTGYVFRLR